MVHIHQGLGMYGVPDADFIQLDWINLIEGMQNQDN